MKATVLMPVYNGEKYLKETIESVLNQTFIDFEFIIMDDGSNDNSIQIIENFSDQRIKLIKLKHSGIVEALNKGLEIAQGEYIIRVDADDVSVKERFQKLIDFMEANRDVAVCGSWAESINENGESAGELKYPPIENIDIKKYILLHNPFIHPSVIFRKDIIKKLGGYRKFKHNEDYELWTRVLKIYEGHNIPEKLIKYRIHSDQITKKSNCKMRIVGLYVRFLALIKLKL